MLLKTIQPDRRSAFWSQIVQRLDGRKSKTHANSRRSGLLQFPPWRLVAIFGLSVAATTAATVNCTGGSSDTSAIQSAVNAGGTVTINGTCNIANPGVNVNNSVTITGNATLNGSTSFSIFNVAADSVSITGLTFSGTTAVHLWGSGQRNNFTFSHNTVQNTNGNDGIDFDPIMHYSTITFNKFFNVGPSNLASYVFDGSCYATQSCTMSGTAIGGLSGWDNSAIENNTFDMCAEGIHISWDLISQDRYYTPTSNVSVSYNTFTRIHRIALEVQGTTTYTPCAAGTTNMPPNCSDLNHIYSDNFKVAGNYAHDFFQPYIDTFGFSLPHANNALHINNSVLLNNPTSTNGQTASAFEISGANVLNQGNVLAADYFAPFTPHGWGSNIVYGGQLPGSLFTSQNNVLCTDQEMTTDFAFEGGAKPSVLNQYNFRANACLNAGHLTTSQISVSSTGVSTSGASRTLGVAVVSALSIRNVQFFLDGSSAPIVTQELQDLNNNFAADRKWLYHATLDTSHLGGGSHSLTAVATDVSGGTGSVTASFTVGATSSPVAQLSSGALSFGSQTLGLQSPPQTVTVTNVGAAAMNISGVNLTGVNAGDFKPTTNCVASMAPSGSCTISAVFTPTTTGAESASFVISDDASGSPQTVMLTGIGVAPAAAAAAVTARAPFAAQSQAASTLPTNLPGGMILWLANDAGVVDLGGRVSTWKDQSGNGADAVQTTAANQPTLQPANNQQQGLVFDGRTTFMTIPSLPIAGLTGMSVFIVSANNHNVDTPGYGISSFLSWPETAPWGTTFFGSYQTSAHFRFGTTEVGNDNTYSFPFSRSNSFGLSEFMHAGATDSMWFNGQAVGTYPGKWQTLAGTGVSAVLGQGLNNSYYPGQVSEVIVYSRSLADAERQTVEQYLMSKYHL